jgi:hypothetical protein
MSGWKYYNHALLPAVAPHEEADVQALNHPDVWHFDANGKRIRPLFARWTSDFDCGYDTGWYHCILDKPFNINALKSSYRYEINRAIKDCDARVIDVNDYAEQMYEVYIADIKTYKNRIAVPDKDAFCAHLRQWKEIVFGVFPKGSDVLAGWNKIRVHPAELALISQKSKPEFQKMRINLALIYAVCEYFKEDLASGKYICDGERNVYHVSNFMLFLEKYFGFHKVYCKLHIKYNPYLNMFLRPAKSPHTYIHTYIHTYYPFRKLIAKLPFTFARQLSVVLTMEEIVKKQEKL